MPPLPHSQVILPIHSIGPGLPFRPGQPVVVCGVFEIAGAAGFMHEAVQVNPYDVDAIASAIGEALSMPKAEQKKRMKALRFDNDMVQALPLTKINFYSHFTYLKVNSWMM